MKKLLIFLAITMLLVLAGCQKNEREKVFEGMVTAYGVNPAYFEIERDDGNFEFMTTGLIL